MRTTVPIIAFLLLAVGLFTPQYAQADALFLTSLPYENASGWDFTSSSWSNKIVIKPEAFGSNLDPDKYTYSLQVKTDCGVQVGHAVWTGDTEDWKDEISGSGGNGNLQENGYCMFRGVQGIERTSTDCTIFSANPGGPGLAYRYPEGPFPHEIYTRPDGGHGQGSGSGDDDDPSDDPEPPTDFKEAIALDSQHWGIQKDDDTSWGRYYTIDSFALKHFLNICRYGKLHITLQASTNEAQCAAYYNNTSNDYDHNNHGSDHLIGDSHEGGKYYFSDFSGEKTWTIDLTKEQVINLSELGLRIDASFCRVTDIKWETPEPGVTFDEESFDLEKPVNHDMTRGDYHIVPTRFAELRDGYDLLFYVESQPAAKRQAKQSRAAGDADECQIYTLNDDKSKTYLDNIEYQPAYGSYRMTDITPEQIAKFQRNGLYVSGTGRFLSVEAASRNVATGVGEIHSATDGRAQIFTLTGVPVTDMTPGNVYIVVRNGKARKMIR